MLLSSRQATRCLHSGSCFAAFALFTSGSATLVRLAIERPAYAVAILMILLPVGMMLRRRRLATWREIPLMFDDELPDQPLQLGL